MTWLSDATVDHLRDVADWPVVRGGRYEIVEPLARGGMGTVYRARDCELRRDVAIKVLSATSVDSEAVSRMRQEARVLARLEHPGIVPIYDVGLLEDGRMFYVMKLVQGPRLDEHAAKRPLTERLRLFMRIGEAVAFAHAHGVLHRDLKPENVMVGPFGEVLVMDWGVALLCRDAAMQAQDPATGADARTSLARSAKPCWIVGTRGYMAPEQARGEPVDARADIFALGGLLHFLLTGAPPDSTAAGGPRPLQAICRKAQSADAAARYADVWSLARDVDRFLAGESVTAAPERAVDRAARFARKHRPAILLIAVYLLLRVLIAWLAA